MYKAGVLGAVVIATGWAVATSGVMSGLDGTRAHQANPANQASDDSQDCSARYAALLDLAELARRDGKSSEVVVRGLSDRRGAMSECLPMTRGETAKP